ncbi:hypothetical protein [Mucilaginibacter antarcticus]|uniref:hypothetical protein n=1 Tax=Mucilaginibacter antarcticus TaxID=1855725 RepID=UPI0036273173
MKILYAIQGTGNGHLSRSMDIVPLLKKMGDVDVLVSGMQGDLNLPFPIKYKLHGFGFIFGKSGVWICGQHSLNRVSVSLLKR